MLGSLPSVPFHYGPLNGESSETPQLPFLHYSSGQLKAGNRELHPETSKSGVGDLRRGDEWVIRLTLLLAALGNEGCCDTISWGSPECCGDFWEAESLS